VVKRRRARQRKSVSPARIRLLRPILRRSETRQAWVLRVVGNRFGPVFVDNTVPLELPEIPLVQPPPIAPLGPHHKAIAEVSPPGVGD